MKCGVHKYGVVKYYLEKNGIFDKKISITRGFKAHIPNPLNWPERPAQITHKRRELFSSRREL